MFGNWKRALFAGALALGIAGCKVIPDDGRPPVTQPAPQPDGEPDFVLPADDGRHRVALLVPLSGSNAAVGQSIANAATMALLDTNSQNLRITTYDTATGADSAAARAVRDGNKLILGPLMGSDVPAIIARARRADVPLIAFSNDTAIAARDVFVMGMMPEQSIARTVDHAIAQGNRRFAALIPAGEYGKRAQAALVQQVTAQGGKVVAIEEFDRGNTSIISAADRLRARGDFDAVLIADGVRLSAMAGGSLKSGNDGPRLLGTELWSGDDDLVRSSALRGAWFSAVSDGRYRQFVTSYQSRFGEAPYRIATLGYDAVLLTLRVARDWRPGKDFPVSALLDPGGFLGLDGPFRFRRDGFAERAMEVRQVGNGAITIVDPAPARF